MIQQSDALIDPFRPGVMERLGLGPGVFLGQDGLNDSLVYARLAGYVLDKSPSWHFLDVHVPPAGSLAKVRLHGTAFVK